MLDVLDLFSQMLTFCVGAFMMLCGSMGAISAFNSLRLVVFAPDFQPHRNGRIIARGVVCATDPSQVQVTPLSQTPCLAYCLDIVESRGRRTRAYLYTERRGQWNLTVQTANGSLAVDACDLDLNTVYYQDMQHPFKPFADRRSHKLLSDANISPKNLAGMHRSLTLTESILREGDQVSLMGRQTWASQQRSLKDAIITDQPIGRFILKATVMFIASALVVYLSIGVIYAAFR